MSYTVQPIVSSPGYNYIEDPEFSTKTCLEVLEEARKAHEKVKQDLADLQKRFEKIDNFMKYVVTQVKITPELVRQIEMDADIGKINECVTGIALNLKNTSQIVSSIIAHDVTVLDPVADLGASDIIYESDTSDTNDGEGAPIHISGTKDNISSSQEGL